MQNSLLHFNNELSYFMRARPVTESIQQTNAEVQIPSQQRHLNDSSSPPLAEQALFYENLNADQKQFLGGLALTGTPEELLGVGYLEWLRDAGQYAVTALGIQALEGASLLNTRTPTEDKQANMVEEKRRNATPKQLEILHECWETLERVCRKLSPRNSEDVAQFARMRFLEKPPDSEVPAQVRDWLFTVARNHAIAQFYRNKREDLSEAPETEVPADPSVHVMSPEEELIKSEFSQENTQALRTLSKLLSPDQWQLIVELYIKERDPAEVADELGITLNALAARKMRVWETIVRIAEQQAGGSRRGRKKGTYEDKERLLITPYLEWLMTKKKLGKTERRANAPQD